MKYSLLEDLPITVTTVEPVPGISEERRGVFIMKMLREAQAGLAMCLGPADGHTSVSVTVQSGNELVRKEVNPRSVLDLAAVAVSKLYGLPEDAVLQPTASSQADISPADIVSCTFNAFTAVGVDLNAARLPYPEEHPAYIATEAAWNATGAQFGSVSLARAFGGTPDGQKAG